MNAKYFYIDLKIKLFYLKPSLEKKHLLVDKTLFLEIFH